MIPQIPSLSCLPFFLYDPLFYNLHAFFFYLYNRHTYQVSSLCALPLRSLRRKEVNWKKSAWDYLLLCIVVFLVTYTKFGNFDYTNTCVSLPGAHLFTKKSQGCRFGAMAPKMASSQKSQRRWVNFRRQHLSLFQFMACWGSCSGNAVSTSTTALLPPPPQRKCARMRKMYDYAMFISDAAPS